MRVVIQRVLNAAVFIDNKNHAEINRGLLILVAFNDDDTPAELDKVATKIANLRIFQDENDKMNLSLADINGEVLLVSQFTLFASTRKGNRPSFLRAAKPELAIQLYQDFIQKLQAATKIDIKTGIFGADMKIHLVNDGPVTIIIDSQDWE